MKLSKDFVWISVSRSSSLSRRLSITSREVSTVRSRRLMFLTRAFAACRACACVPTWLPLFGGFPGLSVFQVCECSHQTSPFGQHRGPSFNVNEVWNHLSCPISHRHQATPQKIAQWSIPPTHFVRRRDQSSILFLLLQNDRTKSVCQPFRRYLAIDSESFLVKVLYRR